MSDITVNDIIGKGFAYEQNPIEAEPTQPFGTKLATVGVANWGKKFVPTGITGGYNEFISKFGEPIVDASLDTSAVMLQKHFNNSPYAYFTRITDGSDSKAELSLNKPASTAKLSASNKLIDSNLNISPYTKENGNNLLSVSLVNAGVSKEYNIALPTSVQATALYSIDLRSVTDEILSGSSSGKYNYNVNDIIQFEIDGTNYSHIVASGDAFTSLETKVITEQNTSLKPFYTYADAWSEAVASLIPSASNFVKVVGNTVEFSSGVYGPSSKIRIISTPNLFNATPDTSSGSDISVSSVLSAINSEFSGDGSIYLNSQSKAEISSDGSGLSSSVTVNSEGVYRFKVTDYYDGSGTISGSFPTGFDAILASGNGKLIEDDGSTETVVATDTTTGGTLADSLDASYLSSSYTTNGYTINLNLAGAGAKTTTNESSIDLTSVDLTSVSANGPYGFKLNDGYEEKEIVFYVSTITQSDLVSLINNAFGYSLATATGAISNGILLESKYNEDVSADGFANIASPTTVGVADVSTTLFGGGFTVTGGSQDATAPAIGVDIYIEVTSDSADINDELFFTAVEDTTKFGEDTTVGPIFNAIYTGTFGNNFKIVKINTSRGDRFDFYSNGNLIESLLNFSYEKAAANYIGKIISNNKRIKEFVEFDDSVAATYVDNGKTYIYSFADGEYKFSGGSNGIGSISDSLYVGEISKFNNTKLYDIDIVGVPNNSSQAVANAILSLCKKRRDCFTVLDSPFGETISSVIDWHNGKNSASRDEKIDSIYAGIYWPWVYDEIDSANTLWVAPSTVVLPTFSRVDSSRGHKFGSVVGEILATLPSVVDMEYYFDDEEHNELYADEYGNNINPINYTITDGFFIDGNKSTSRADNKLNRIHNVRSGLYIKKNIYNASKNFFWQPVDPTTRKNFKASIEEILDVLVANRSIEEDYNINVSKSVNTDAVKAKDGMVAVITYTPINLVEKIKVVANVLDDNVTVTFEAA